MRVHHLRPARTSGEVSLKVDHAGEHGAVAIYRAQRWIARWRAPSMVEEIDHFLAHEERHRALFARELAHRNVRRCRSYHFCGAGGLTLGVVTGLFGARMIALTTEAVERVVLRHLERQLEELHDHDRRAAAVITTILADEREHHDSAADRLGAPRSLDPLISSLIRSATEAVIWMGFWRRR